MVVEAALQFGGEWAFPHAGGVGLCHPNHPVDQGGSYPRTDAGPPGDGIGGGDIGIGAVVEIQQGALGTLEKNVLAGPGRLVNRAGAIDHVGGQSGAVAGVFGNHGVGIQGLQPVDLGEQFVLLGEGR